ncbi:hypothetical protein EIK77_000021 [Talaromyces pinophilus]|nr:hypothetical protein EIK77_000021 [Talaromyces pinophilus]
MINSKLHRSLMVGVVHNTDRINQHLDFAQLGGVVDAMLDSFADRDETECLAGTRTDLLQRIVEWALSPSQKLVFWLRGMAGTGKSTISRTVAKAPLLKPHLSASFFFKTGEGDRGNAKKFFPTLVRQLILWNPELSPGVKNALDHDPDIASKSLGEQFEKLPLQPLLSFDQLRRDRDISQDWPSSDDILKLTRISVPLFISAATICRYIGNSKLEPKSRLKGLLENQANYISKMEKTYMPILTRLLDGQESHELEQQKLLQEVQDIIGVIILLAAPLSIKALSRFLKKEIDEISNLLNLFRSVLHIPVDRDQPVRIHHLSFRDFLVTYKTKFQVNEQQKHRDIAGFCFEVMYKQLKKDICDLKNPNTLAFSPDSQRLVSVFADNSACLWDTATGVLQHAFENEDKGYSNNWLKVFSPNGQLLASSSSYGTIKVRGTATGGLQHTLKGDSYNLSSMAFSPDSKILASGSRDRTIRLWDMTTGTLRHTLRGPTKRVSCIAFSPNGQQLASGSDDNTVRIWDTAIRVSQQTLSEGHSESVKSVVFSPDGQLLASSSYVPLLESSSNDRTVLLWHTAAGKLLHTFESNLSDIYLVAFSPESRFLAVSSSRSIVRIWDTATGVMIGSCIKGKMTELKFSTDLSSSTTDITARGILRWLSNNNQKSSKSMANIGVRGGLGGQWVTLQGNEILWLPSEYRSTCSAVKHRTLALGHASGRVSFLHFNLN